MGSGATVVPLERLRGLEIDASSGNEDAPEWVDLATHLLDAFGARPSAPHPHVVGPGETARHLRSHGLPILTMSECPAVPGALIRPLVDPIPVYPRAIVHRSETSNPELATLDSVMTTLAAEEGWQDLPADPWLPPADAGWSRR